MIRHSDIDDSDLKQQIKSLSIQFAGNAKLRIYGILNCKSGKQMKHENRVFFESESEAIENGYRPCGHCIKGKYEKWISLKK